MAELYLLMGWLFVVTHVDTFVVLVAFCADDLYRPREILVGHYLGFSIGLGIAVLAALVVAEVASQWAFLLGLVPIALGLHGFARREVLNLPVEPIDVPEPQDRVGAVAAAGVGLSGENVAAYVPVLATADPVAIGLVVLGYLVGAGLIFTLAYAVTIRTVGRRPPAWVQTWLVPAVLVIVGGYVLVAGWLAL